MEFLRNNRTTGEQLMGESWGGGGLPAAGVWAFGRDASGGLGAVYLLGRFDYIPLQL